MSRLFLPSRAKRPYRGSVLLASCTERIGRALLAVACLWGMTGWAMGWW